MRYRFRGLLRDTGKPVEGHVEAPSVDQAYALMGDNNIVCESLREDPRLGDFTRAEDAPAPGGGGGGGGDGDDFTNAIDSALDTSSTQVNVDDLWRKYRGQRVRVIDRDKIRNRVMSVVSKAMLGAGAGGAGGAAGEQQTLQRVEEALTKMFGDNQNLTSEISAGQAAAQAAGPPSAQMGQLTDMVLDLQKSMAELKALVRKGGGGWGGGGGGGGGGRRGAMIKSVKDPKNDKVLLEIFETNVKLQKSSATRHGGGGAAAAIAAAGAPAKSGPSEAAKRLAAQSKARDEAKKAARPD